MCGREKGKDEGRRSVVGHLCMRFCEHPFEYCLDLLYVSMPGVRGGREEERKERRERKERKKGREGAK